MFVGDSRDLSRVSDASVELVVTSPPYPMIEIYMIECEFSTRYLEIQSSLGSLRILIGISVKLLRFLWPSSFSYNT